MRDGPLRLFMVLHLFSIWVLFLSLLLSRWVHVQSPSELLGTGRCQSSGSSPLMGGLPWPTARPVAPVLSFL